MKKQLLTLLLAGAVLPLAAAPSNALVASPGRTADVTYAPHLVKGKDYHYLLKETWFSLNGVKDEKFVREAGLLGVKWNIKWSDYSPARVMFLRDIKINGHKAFSLKYVPSEDDTKIYNPNHLLDADMQSAAAVSASIASVKKRFAPVETTLQIRFKRPQPLQSVDLAYGKGRNKAIGKVRFFNGSTELIPVSVTNEKLTLTAKFNSKEICSNLRIVCTSATPKFTLEDFDSAIQERLANYPFTSHLMRPVPFGIMPENVDRAAAEKLLSKYQDTHLGICFAEWDSQGFFQSYNENNRLFKEIVAQFGEKPRTREELLSKMTAVWKWHKNIFFDSIWGLSGAFGTVHYGTEWGGNAAGLELTNHTSTIPHRTLMRYTAGAGRQYNKPWLLYLAYYMGKFSPDSTRVVPPKDAKNWISGPDAGVSPSFIKPINGG